VAERVQTKDERAVDTVPDSLKSLHANRITNTLCMVDIKYYWYLTHKIQFKQQQQLLCFSDHHNHQMQHHHHHYKVMAAGCNKMTRKHRKLK